METVREIALRTYKEAVSNGMLDTPMNWYIWKRAFYTADAELKKFRLVAVSKSLPSVPCECGQNFNPYLDGGSCWHCETGNVC